MKVEFKKIQGYESVTVREGETREGKPYRIVEQVGYIHLKSKPFPVEVRIRLEKETDAYADGIYELDLDKSVQVDRFGGLQFSFILALVPAAKAGQARMTSVTK